MTPTTPKATPVTDKYPTPEAIREAARNGVSVALSEVVRLFRAQNDERELGLRVWRLEARRAP